MGLLGQTQPPIHPDGMETGLSFRKRGPFAANRTSGRAEAAKGGACPRPLNLHSVSKVILQSSYGRIRFRDSPHHPGEDVDWRWTSPMRVYRSGARLHVAFVQNPAARCTKHCDRALSPEPEARFHGPSGAAPLITFRASDSKRGSPRNGPSLRSILMLPKTPVSKGARSPQLFSNNRNASSLSPRDRWITASE